MKQYNIEAYSNTNIICDNGIMKKGDKFPCIVTEEILNRYRPFLNIINCEEIIIQKIYNNQEEVTIVNEENIEKPKRKYVRKAKGE